MHILGISCYFHDAAAALLADGVLVAAAEEERFTRKKHDFEFPQNAIDFCLNKAGITAGDLDYVIFFEKPFVKFERLLLSSMQTFPRSHRVFRESMVSWLGDKLWVKNLLRKKLGIAPSKILFSEHHLSHAASAFLCSPFDQAAILTVDGVGEWTTAAVGIGKGTDIRLIKEIRFPHSLGLLYSAFTAFLGFEVNEGEYKVMGMAPFGRPRYTEEVYKLIRVSPDGSFEMDMDYFSYHYSADTMYSRKFLSLFGDPREPASHFFTDKTGFPSYFGEQPSNYAELAHRNQHYADIAASVQSVVEEIVLKMARYARRETGLDKLCIAGGVALNSVANGRVLRESLFTDVFIQPAAGDSGGALGAALYGYHTVLGQPRKFVMQHAYWGSEFSESAIDQALRDASVSSIAYEDDQKLIEKVVESLLAGKVIGWFQGRSEWGPRGLGNRSILADPRCPEMKDIVNLKIKFREPYRPFAPSVLTECAQQLFEVSDPARHYPARFMLYVVNVRKEAQAKIPAITHVDGTGRLQTVSRDTSERYYDLIRCFGDASGVPVLLNTSFNLKGEPMVNTPGDALRTFRISGMDSLVLGNRLIEKNGKNANVFA